MTPEKREKEPQQMKSRLRPKLTYSNVIASIALFVALGGAAVAAGLPKHSVGPQQLKHGAVTAGAIGKAAVTSGKLAPKSVVSGKLGPNSVGPGNIGNGAISTPKLAAGAVIASTIKNGVITTNKLANANVTTAKLADGSVTPAKLSAEIGGTVSSLKSGQTLRGVFDVGSSGFKVSTGSQSFPLPLVNSPAAPNTNIVEAGKPTTACPGITGGNAATPQAAPGQLCVYITSKAGKALEGLSFDPEVTNRLGFGLRAGFEAPDVENVVRGQWAVTAP
jgi:hypothetical protein